MALKLLLFVSTLLVCHTHTVNTQDLPTNYEYYTSDGINSGLSADQTYFTLNGKNISIYSGSLHYFRVPRAYWRDTLTKMRAVGLNTVETYIPWNLHEPRSGEFDFGNGNNAMSDFLHLEEFLTIAREEDLFVIIRSGPFICAEFEFGGFPSWLLREDDLGFRTSDPVYMGYVLRYFNVLLPRLVPFQFTNRGPIIMFQVENEYAVGGNHDLQYLKELRQIMLDNGIKELLVTSDNPPRGTAGTIPEYFLMTANFDTNATYQLDTLRQYQPDKPVMVMEYWSGWFDYWGSRHNTKDVATYQSVYEEILAYPASVNIYIFRGGTNFGFLNGAQNLKYDDLNTDYHSIVTSYDYGAPLDESGNYTDKYYATRDLLAKYNPIKTKLPDPPEVAPKTVYTTTAVEEKLLYPSLLDSVEKLQSQDVLPMEKLDINNGSGQSYGYIVYRKKNVDLPAASELLIEGRVCDTVTVLVNGVLMSPMLTTANDLNGFGTSRVENSTLSLNEINLAAATVDLIVENWGRINVRVYKGYKGLWQGGVRLNEEYIEEYEIFPLEFGKEWITGLDTWRNDIDYPVEGPCLYRAVLDIDDEPTDTYIDMSEWYKGVVLVNGFALGRYARMGPIQTLYLPGTLLQKGRNEIIVFEQYRASDEITFTDQHIYLNR